MVCLSITQFRLLIKMLHIIKELVVIIQNMSCKHHNTTTTIGSNVWTCFEPPPGEWRLVDKICTDCGVIVKPNVVAVRLHMHSGEYIRSNPMTCRHKYAIYMLDLFKIKPNGHVLTPRVCLRCRPMKGVKLIKDYCRLIWRNGARHLYSPVVSRLGYGTFQLFCKYRIQMPTARDSHGIFFRWTNFNEYWMDSNRGQSLETRTSEWRNIRTKFCYSRLPDPMSEQWLWNPVKRKIPNDNYH